MFDTLYIGTSGLLSNAQGLKIVSNNLANVNTPGFKSSQLRFSDLFEQGGGVGGQSAQQGSVGQGVSTLGASLNFRPGNDQSTGNALDQSINGNGMFVVRRDGELRYTRAGDFQFDGKEILTNGAGDHVQSLDAGGALVDVSLDALGNSAAKATTSVKFSGNLSTVAAVPPVDAVLNGVVLVDAGGINRKVNLSFKDIGAGSYTVTVSNDATPAAVLTTGTLKFVAGATLPGSDSITLQYPIAGQAALTVKLDFSSNVTAGPVGNPLAVLSQDGVKAGVRTGQTIGADGVVSVRYSNGETVKGPRLALAQFVTENDLTQVGGGAFTKTPDGQVQYGYAGVGWYGGLQAGHREGSNVDLAEEFSNLIVMQRGYQAASHVISTANDMIQELFDMKGHR